MPKFARIFSNDVLVACSIASTASADKLWRRMKSSVIGLALHVGPTAGKKGVPTPWGNNAVVK